MSAHEDLPERVRNDLLRRVDWRFLVPQEDEPRVQAPPGADLARALALVGSDADSGGRPSLVALVDPGRLALAEAAARLAPGGTLYAEWRRPQLRGRARLGQRLEAAGFEGIRWYWPWPPPGRRPSFWLPLDAADALAFFLSPRLTASAVWRRLLARVWPWALRLRLLAPLCAVARLPGGGPDAVESAVRIHAGGSELSWILLSGGRRRVNKVVGLPVARSEAKPRLAVKFARSVDEDEPLRREARVLRSLADSRPELAGVPRALFLERRCGRLALGETALDGEPLLWRLDRTTFDRLSVAVTAWLVDLAGRGEPRPPEAWTSRLVDAPFERFTGDFAAVLSPREIERARAALSSLGSLPLVPEQRDCAPWNVLLAGDAVSLADWESAEPSGLPGLDLVYFLTNAALLVDGVLDSGPFAPSYAAALDPRTETGATVARCQALYCERVGVAEALLPALRLLCWTIHARSEYRRFELDASRRPPPQLLQTSLFLELWREELARQTP